MSFRTVLVTGANRGLGFELCQVLLRRGGYHVIASARSWKPSGGSGSISEGDSSPQATLKAIYEDTIRMPSKHYAHLSFVNGLDVGDLTSRLNSKSVIAAALGTSKLDVLVNMAGIYTKNWTQEDFDKAMAVNAYGPLYFAQELAPSMSDNAHVVNVSSGLGKLSNVSETYKNIITGCKTIDELVSNVTFIQDDAQKDITNGSYNLSKAVLNRGTHILAQEWAKSGPRVNSVDPGWCSTDMGGAQAPRSARDGAMSVFALIEGVAAPGKSTGGFWSPHGQKYPEW